MLNTVFLFLEVFSFFFNVSSSRSPSTQKSVHKSDEKLHPSNETIFSIDDLTISEEEKCKLTTNECKEERKSTSKVKERKYAFGKSKTKSIQVEASKGPIRSWKREFKKNKSNFHAFYLCSNCLKNFEIIKDKYKIPLITYDSTKFYSLIIPVRSVSKSGRINLSKVRLAITDTQSYGTKNIKAKCVNKETIRNMKSKNTTQVKIGTLPINIRTQSVEVRCCGTKYKSRQFKKYTNSIIFSDLFHRKAKHKRLKLYLDNLILQNAELVLNNILWYTLPAATFVSTDL
ncbi:uncharacterized protein [Centruroides vittatus]|uniref:uncharacterized protein n=1 Tax=Centruroides vittatus TaxID=120091 RepID=UPI00350EB7B7